MKEFNEKHLDNLVRCKDCKWAGPSMVAGNIFCHVPTPSDNCTIKSDDDYCVLGEKEAP